MKELKFRVYDKDLGKYLEGCEIDNLMADLCSEGDGRAVIIKQLCPARYIFEQYTGLKDRNGKEICEGDVVRIGLYLFDKAVGVVEQHKDGSWLVIDRSDKVDMPYSLYHHPEGVVIGNIHESNIEELRRKNERELQNRVRRWGIDLSV